ncbi:MAG: hypothetical protein RSD63_06230 [Eubacterium sp.]
MMPIIFDEESIQKIIIRLESLQEEMENCKINLISYSKALAENNEIPELIEKMFKEQRFCEEQCQRILILVKQLKLIKDVYITTEMKNIQLVKKLPELLSMRIMKINEAVLMKIGDTDFSKYRVSASSMINNHSVQHEEWLLQTIENYI